MELEVYYENSEKNKRIVFDEKEYGISDFDLFQHEFKYSAEDDKISKFSSGVTTRKIEANITGNEKKSWQELYDEMNGVFVRDILLQKPGTLHVNKCYMPCFFYATIPTEMFEDWGFQTAELKIVTDKALWTEKQLVAVYKSDTIPDSSGIIYDYTYGSAYGDSGLSVNFYNDHFIPCNFALEAKGPLSKLEFAINENLYEINVSCAEGESVVLDTKERTIKVIDSYGNSWNAFGKQNFDFDNFAKIPAGENVISYNRSYDIYLTIYQERSEPRWTAGIKYMLTEDGYVLATEKDQILVLG